MPRSAYADNGRFRQRPEKRRGSDARSWRVEHAVRLHGGPDLAVNVLPAGPAEDGPRFDVAVSGADGHNRAALVKMLLVETGLFLADAKSGQRAQDPADRGAGNGAADEAGEDSAGQDRPEAGDGRDGRRDDAADQ